MAIYYSSGSLRAYQGSNLLGAMYVDSYQVNPGSYFISASGGTITYSGSYAIHTFTTSSTFTVWQTGVNPNVELLMVAGGGGGSGPFASAGGVGGGGGGLIYSSSYPILTANYNIIVGSGGIGGTYNTINPGGNGQNSSFDTLIAIGGGGGGGRDDGGKNGGSGGGAGISANPEATGSGTPGQGNNGGTNSLDFPNYGGGGGGGAATQGGTGSINNGGNGGDGVPFSISGTPTYYAGGGASSYYGGGGTNGIAGLGGSSVGASGSANTGAGGGGADNGSSLNGSNGGSGIVIIKYQYQ